MSKRERTRESALTRPCPKCGAAAGERCISTRRSRQARKAPHIQRYRPSEAVATRKHRRTWPVAERVGEVGEGNKLAGLYPWLRFEGLTCEQWVQCYGIDLQLIDRKAADIYLEGEADFFEDEDGVGTLAKQRTIEDLRIQFADAGANLCGSPIEQMIFAALLWVGYGYRQAPVEIWNTTMPFEKPQTDVVIAPQYQIGAHRVDFAVFVNGVASEEIKLVVECDGHNFHEKTKEQAARDKKRDRDLQIAGWKVLRFTGSEICRDWYECAAQIDLLAANETDAQLRRRGLIK